MSFEFQCPGRLRFTIIERMGNSISLNFLANDTHLTVNSHRLQPRQLGSPLSPRSDASSEVSGALSAIHSGSSLDSFDGGTATAAGVKSPHPKMRQCWICYGEEEIVDSPDFVASWVAPCNCKGTTKWVHQACLLDWIDSQVMNNATLAANRISPVINNSAATNQAPSNLTTTPLLSVHSPASGSATNPAPRFLAGDGPLVLESVKLSCPQCHAPYKISEAYALPRRVLLLVDYLAKWKERALMYSTLGLVSGSIYTVAFSYGMFSGWMIGGREYFEFIREAFDPVQGSILNRFQISAGIPLTPLFALSSTFSAFSWIYPLVPLFLFDGRHRIALSQPRGILLFLPLIWSTHRVLIDSLIPSIYRKLIRRNQPSIEYSEAYASPSTEAAESTISLTIVDEADSIGSTEDSLSASVPSNSTVKISILSTTAALLFPSAAAITGWAIASLLPKTFASISPFYRSLIGASVLVTFKDLSRLLYWYQNVRLRKYRRVLNRSE